MAVHDGLKITLSVVLVLVASTREAAAEDAAAVIVPHSRIKLMDHAVLASDLNGIIKFVVPQEGDRVQPGEVVAGLRDEVAAAALAAAKRQAEDDTEIRYADAAAALAVHEFETGEELFRRKALTDAELRRLKLEADRGLLQAEKARFDQEVFRLARDEKAAQLKTYSIQAPPFAGVVTRVLKSPGEAVRQGDPVLEVVGTARLRVEGYLPVHRVSGLRRGDRVEVRAEGENIPRELVGRVFSGRLMFIDPSVEPNTLTVRVWSEVSNPDSALLAGMLAEMTIFPGTAGFSDEVTEGSSSDEQLGALRQ